MRYIPLLLLFIFLFCNASAETGDNTKKFTVSGKISDKSSGEALFGATVYIKELRTGTASDMYGNYSLTLEEGAYTLVVSYIGYNAVSRTIDLKSNSTLYFEMEPRQETLNEVEITSEKDDKNVLKPEMSTFKMDIKTLPDG
jgi:hypothetical protein